MEGVNTVFLTLLFDPLDLYRPKGKSMVKNKSEATGWAQLNTQIYSLAREVGELDPDDPKRAELINEIYRLTELAKSSRQNALSASIASYRKRTISSV